MSKHSASAAPDWEGVAAKMKEQGYLVRGRECSNRWHVYQKYIHKGMRSCADWTPDEVRIYFILLYLVFQKRTHRVFI